MSAMDHATAHDRIEELLVEPALLEALGSSTDPADVGLREHLDACAACRADLEGWRTVQRRIAAALPTTESEASAAVEPIDVPPSLRTRVAASIRPLPAAREPLAISASRGGGRGLALPGWLAVAAAIVIVFGGAAVVLDQAKRLATAEAESRALATVLAAVDGVLAAEHRIVELRRPDGSAAGSISWSRHDWVVLTTALTAPPANQRFKCWLEDGSRSVAVGDMEFAGGTAYWVATLDEWQTWEIGPDTQFVVSLEAADAQSRAGDIVLSADLGS
jgi:hypothetical protein